jgi:hypothetical protein
MLGTNALPMLMLMRMPRKEGGKGPSDRPIILSAANWLFQRPQGEHILTKDSSNTWERIKVPLICRLGNELSDGRPITFPRFSFETALITAKETTSEDRFPRFYYQI